MLPCMRRRFHLPWKRWLFALSSRGHHWPDRSGHFSSSLQHSLPKGKGVQRVFGAKDSFQLGFKFGYSTETALVSFVYDLWHAQDWGSAPILVLLDLSAALDTINHGIFLRWLRGLGWKDRVMMVLLPSSVIIGVRGKRSSLRTLFCGVTQGSSLSPFLFNIYMKALGEVVH